MRNRLFLLMLVLFFISCKDEGTTSNTNRVSYNGKAFNLEHGFIKDYGANWNNTTRDYDVFLFTREITLSTTGAGSVFTGTGDGVNLEFNSPSLDQLGSGDYTWSSISTEPGTLIFGRVYLNFNTTTHASGNFIDATDGSASVQRNGNEYKIDFTLNLDGKTLTGTYTGNLEAMN